MSQPSTDVHRESVQFPTEVKEVLTLFAAWGMIPVDHASSPALLAISSTSPQGDVAVRRQELMATATALRLAHVEVLDFQDCRVTDDFPSRLKIADTQRYDAIDRFLAVVRARGFARRIGYAQSFIVPGPLTIDDPSLLVMP